MLIKGWKRLLFVALLIGAGIFVWVKIQQGKDPGVTIREVHPYYGSIQKFVSATGNVQPQNRLEMKSPISGRVDKILVEEGQAVKTGDILALLSSTDRAALLDTAKPQGAEAVRYWEEVYKPTPIIAAIDGEVIVKSVQPGQTVTPSDAIVVLSDRLIVEAQVDETDIGKVKEGQKAVITLDAYPEIKVDAKVGHIYYESKIVNNVTIYNVDIIADKIPSVFRSGMSANVRIIQESKDNVLMIPLEALKKGREGNMVFVKNGDHKKPSKRSVELGVSDEANVEVISGIGEKDILIIMTQKYSPAKGTKAGNNPFMPSRGGNKK